MNGQSRKTLFRFLVVGGAIALLYATLAALATSRLPVPRALSSGSIWILCIPMGFWLQRRLTFTTRAPHRHGLWLYAAAQLLGVGIVSGVSWLLATGTFWPDLLVHLFASALAAMMSYLISHHFIFPNSPAE